MFWAGLGLLTILGVLAVIMCISGRADKDSNKKKDEKTEVKSDGE